MAFKMNYSKGGFPFKKEKEYEPQTETRKDESTDIIPQTVRDKIEGSHREGQYVPTEERQEEIKKFIESNPGATHEDWYDWHFKGKEYKGGGKGKKKKG